MVVERLRDGQWYVTDGVGTALSGPCPTRAKAFMELGKMLARLVELTGIAA